MTAYDVLEASLPGWLIVAIALALILGVAAISWWLACLDGKRTRRTAHLAQVDQWQAAGRDVAAAKEREQALRSALQREADRQVPSHADLDGLATDWDHEMRRRNR